ncbi:glucose-6-phosphate dehydrogenase [Nakamurella sp. YIM 132087]|uniref:Glucose-6-phosphate 1-dehydrogenase n=1 Tax=Nakamurella alba TaxID=2665158 RepID=A0A7K1FPJ5_9ACTN|nr:glucose-6-phosphate dehydrogenase [Nakamurella alba]MTD15269.1 glucose-6-phosphate dehydrogenase [Nakamurella alba]
MSTPEVTPVGPGPGTDEPDQEPTIFVLFGATGDLAHRMVLPAYYELYRRGLMPAHWVLIGNGRGDVSHEDFQGDVRGAVEGTGVQLDEQEWSAFAGRLRFAGGGFDDTDPGSLLDVIDTVRHQVGDNARYIHYLAVPPVAFGPLTDGLKAHDLLTRARVVYEKPYGTSPQSFQELDDRVHAAMDESQVYRIDHFLGKEATQDLHVLRFANTLVASIWNNRHVAQVQIDVPETLDVADRAAFYDATGAFRDMVATHLFQVAAEIAMEPPVSFSAADLQDARESVIAAFRPLRSEDVVFGQVEGYLDLPEVREGSTTETYAAARLWVDTDRWRDVPFVLRSGKQLAKSEQRVTLILKEPDGPLDGVPLHAGELSFSLAGDGEIELSLVLKKPGPGLDTVRQTMRLSLDDVPDSDPLPPYVALLHDVTLGDRSLFTTGAGLEQAWRAAAPIIDAPPTPIRYAVGSDGPAEGDALTDGIGWVAAQFDS